MGIQTFKLKPKKKPLPTKVLKKPNHWWGYYAVPVGSMLLGMDWFQLYPCGTFVKDGITYQLICLPIIKDECPDVKGVNQEGFDLWAPRADVAFDLLESNIVPSIQAKIAQDMEDGLDAWEILEKRVGVMIPEFKGFTFAEVIENDPDILQPVVTVDDDGNETTQPNIRRCSLEEPA